jgi:KDO2-lipid IV(A) lauroyltransferase
MKKITEYIAGFLILIPLSFFFLFLYILGIEKASRLISSLFLKVGPKLKRHQVVLRNLELCFPDMDKKERELLAIQTWSNLGAMFGEMIFWKFMEMDEIKRKIVVEDDVGAFQKGAKIIVGAHISNFEIWGQIPRMFEFHTHSLYTPLKNGLINKLLLMFRESKFMHFYSNHSHNTLKNYISALNKDEVICMLVDQHRPYGIVTTFFDQPVKTTDLAAKLALKYDSPLFVGRIIRTGLACYKVKTEKLEITENDNALTITQRINDIFEMWIKEYPEQYYWIHRRFKLCGYPNA